MQCCPNCGTNLTKFESMTYGNVSINEFREVIYAGQVVRLGAASKLIVEALIRSRGRTLTRDGIANAIDLEGGITGEGNALNAAISRTRRAFKDIDPNFNQIIAEPKVGYRWQVRAPVELALAA